MTRPNHALHATLSARVNADVRPAQAVSFVPEKYQA
jgi:hypothetical protein